MRVRNDKQCNATANQIIKYKLHSKLGAVKIPSQKKIFPSKRRPRIRRVLLSATSGSCDICRISRYPLSRRKMHSMINSCTQADRRNVMRLADTRDKRYALMELW